MSEDRQIIEAESRRIPVDTSITSSDLRAIADKMDADCVEWLELRTNYNYDHDDLELWERRPETDAEMMRRQDKERRVVATQRRSEEATRKRELTMLANLKAKYESSEPSNGN